MTLAQEVAALRQLDVAGLAARYADLFGEPPRIRHKDWLFGRVAARRVQGGGRAAWALRGICRGAGSCQTSAALGPADWSSPLRRAIDDLS